MFFSECGTTYKAACANILLVVEKAVIIANPETKKPMNQV